MLAKYCSNCRKFVLRYKCKVCNKSDNVIEKEVDPEYYKQEMEVLYPSFKLDRWWKKLFFGFGWLSAFSLHWWITVLIVYLYNKERYDQFFNPAVFKAIYYLGMVNFLMLIIFIQFVIVFVSTIINFVV